MNAGNSPDTGEGRPLQVSTESSEVGLARVKSELLQEMKATKGSRFNAAKRLERRDKRMIAVTAFASVYVILLTVLPLFFHVGEGISSAVTAITIIFSLVILAMSLLQYSNNDPVRAEQHHRCALEINALRRELRCDPHSTANKLFDYSKRYDDILQKYGINHDDIDFVKYKLEHPLEYPAEGTPEKRRDDAQRERPGEWYGYVVGLMSAIAAGIAMAAAFDTTHPAIHRILHFLRVD